jgi:CheY-like chemotaxis protein
MKKKILVADEDESVRRMVARVLEMAGYSVMLAGTGRETVAKSRTGQPDLVLLDLKEPEAGGWEIFEQVNHALNALVPVIVITAWPNQYEQAVQKGVDVLMEKPLDLPLLLQTMSELLTESEQERTRQLMNRNFTTTLLVQERGVGSGA